MNQPSPTEDHVILMDKPLEWTSFDIVKKLRAKLKIRKIGHAGTLDPLATGLLILCTGKKTKQINIIQEQPKEYAGVMILGKTTPSYDLETKVEEGGDISTITEEFLRALIPQFEGEICPHSSNTAKIIYKTSNISAFRAVYFEFYFW